jgi:hypothetical protein
MRGGWVVIGLFLALAGLAAGDLWLHQSETCFGFAGGGAMVCQPRYWNEAAWIMGAGLLTGAVVSAIGFLPRRRALAK